MINDLLLECNGLKITVNSGGFQSLCLETRHDILGGTQITLRSGLPTLGAVIRNGGNVGPPLLSLRREFFGCRSGEPGAAREEEPQSEKQQPFDID